MELQSYLDRVGFVGRVEPSLRCLTDLHRCQALTIAYENLDIQLGRYVDRDRERIFERIVSRGRGGWCYETHELFLWALETIGFDARMTAAAIHRREFGDMRLGNHTAILVQLEQIYLADLGLGDGIREPIPLKEGTYTQGALSFTLERLDDGYWRYHNHVFGYPTDFDFRDQPLDVALIEKYSQELQTSSDSIFVQNLVCQIMQPDSVTCLTGRVLRHKTADGTQKRLIDEADFAATLAEVFGIYDAEIDDIWPKVESRHRALFGDKGIQQIGVSGF